MGIRLQIQLGQSPILELEHLVDPNITEHWDVKNREGIIPADIKKQGPLDKVRYALETEKLSNFEVGTVTDLFEGPWKSKTSGRRKKLHYFGIGDGKTFKKVVRIANKNHHDVIGYDASSVGYVNGRDALYDLVEEGGGGGSDNNVLLADIEFACQRQYVSQAKGSKMIVSRVFNILDKEDLDWEKKPVHERKMARTARTIGLLLPFCDILLIHPCSTDNPHAIWGDTTPHSLEEIVGYMQEVEKSKLELTRRAVVQFYNNIYTAARICRAPFV